MRGHYFPRKSEVLSGQDLCLSNLFQSTASQSLQMRELKEAELKKLEELAAAREAKLMMEAATRHRDMQVGGGCMRALAAYRWLRSYPASSCPHSYNFRTNSSHRLELMSSTPHWQPLWSTRIDRYGRYVRIPTLIHVGVFRELQSLLISDQSPPPWCQMPPSSSPPCPLMMY